METVVPSSPAGKAAVASHLCVGLNVLFFSYLFIEESWLLRGLTREDGWIENLTAVYLLLAGLSLFAAALARRDSFCRRLYVVGGAAMVFVCGEEISWGQRIVGFGTPDFLLELNRQGEFNLHNTYVLPLYPIRNLGILLLFVTAIAVFVICGGRRTGFGGRLALPSIPLAFCFLLVSIYQYLPESSLRGLVVIAGRRELNFLAVVCTLVVIALSCRRRELLVPAVANAVFVSVAVHVNNLLDPSGITQGALNGPISEVNEYLFALACLFYALELWLTPPPPSPGTPAATSRGGISFRSAVPSPVVVRVSAIASCIISIPFAYCTARAALEAAHRLIESSEPAIRSVFDVHVDEDQVVWVREPCVLEDTQPRFLLHLYPADPDELPVRRREAGFENRDFSFDRGGYSNVAGGKCLATRPLPGYEIANIHTGQYVYGPEDPIWMASIDPARPSTFTVQLESMRVGEYLAQRVEEREPAIRLDFDVYVVGNALIYVRERCRPGDVDARFFLHVDAVDPDDLPGDRRQYGFDNLDFGFDALGVRVGGTCVAEAPLPEYGVAAIRTGQIVAAEDGWRRLWEGEVRLGSDGRTPP